MTHSHSFHIPIMGIGFTAETPLKVSQFGIDSVISLVDDHLLEKLRKSYCEKFNLVYDEISEKADDFRAKRVTTYLNLVNKLAEEKFEELKHFSNELSEEIKTYFQLLPDNSSLKKEFKKMSARFLNLNEIRQWTRENLTMGSIDVNIMTKLDRSTTRKGEDLPVEYNDAHAALRGYAKSNLRSSIVLSAGMNPRLYSYMENFDDFYPDNDGMIKKKIILKVSDYRSALIQGKFLAKKGLWVSEYRIESGLNCGGHAFATEGYLMGPILEEFKKNRNYLKQTVFETIQAALTQKKGSAPAMEELPLKITAQGGVGTTEEHEFLMEYYGVNSVGWGSPFLLVPEAVTIDEYTLSMLEKAGEKDLYLSGSSPLGVPFNTLAASSQAIIKYKRAKEGNPGARCTKKFLASNLEFTSKPSCTASKEYQKKKIEELKNQNADSESYARAYQKIIEKECLCNGLGEASLIEHGMSAGKEVQGVSVCPGPNIAYFSKRMSLKQMVDHIYGRTDVIKSTERPNMFIKELHIYLDYLAEKIQENARAIEAAGQEKYLRSFVANLGEGITYYSSLFSNTSDFFRQSKKQLATDLKNCTAKLNMLRKEIDHLFLKSTKQSVS